MSLITYLTKIRFEPGAARLLADELRLLGVKHPLIMTDKGLVATGMPDRIIQAGKLPRHAGVRPDAGEPHRGRRHRRPRHVPRRIV